MILTTASHVAGMTVSPVHSSSSLLACWSAAAASLSRLPVHHVPMMYLSSARLDYFVCLWVGVRLVSHTVVSLASSEMQFVVVQTYGTDCWCISTHHQSWLQAVCVCVYVHACVRVAAGSSYLLAKDNLNIKIDYHWLVS